MSQSLHSLMPKEVPDTHFRTQNPTFGKVKSKAYQEVDRPSHVQPAASAGTKTHEYIATPFVGHYFHETIADNPAKSESQTHTRNHRPMDMHASSSVHRRYARSLVIASHPSPRVRQADIQGSPPCAPYTLCSSAHHT